MPDSPRGDRWIRAMRRGDFEAGWRLSDDAVRSGAMRRPDIPRHLQIVWAGTPLDGRRVLVLCYHGLGDIVQFSRYLPALQAIAGEMAVCAPRRMIPLLETMNLGCRFLVLGDGYARWPHDVDVELMELAHVFRTTLSNLPSGVPYLHPAIRTRPRRAGGRPRIGLAWRSGGWDRSRSIPEATLAPLASLDAQWFALSPREPGRDLPAFLRPSRARGLLPLARSMLTLDLVVSVDTMAAHLAGALALPVWTLLPSPSDWRWMRRRIDSPWYPTMRLFRQRRPGDWAGVVDAVRAELAARLSRNSCTFVRVD